MNALIILLLTLLLVAQPVLAQTPKAPEQDRAVEVVRIATNLVQTDLVVTDKNDQVIPDLRIEDFKVYENGKRQDVQFIEFVSSNSRPRIEGSISVNGGTVGPDVTRNLSAGDLRRVLAFVVDDLTVPHEDVVSVRDLLTNFVDKQMRDGDLVGIVRVSGGRGLLQQFTSDRSLLRRAIAEIGPTLNAYSAFNNITTKQAINTQPQRAEFGDGGIAMPEIASVPDIDVSDQGMISGQRTLITLHTASEVVNSMKTLPGRKNLVLISGGLPLYESSANEVKVNGAPIQIAEANFYINNLSSVLRQLTDRASRAGVVINTMDIRGLKASRGVSLYTDPGNEGRSALFGSGPVDGNFGRSPNMAQFDNKALDTISGHLGLQALSSATGGVSVVNTNSFNDGLNRILSRSSYYLIGYKPSESFDGKFHKLEIKVDRPGVRVYTRAGYTATADAPADQPTTREEALLKAVRSPLAKREIDLTGTLQYRFMPDNSAQIDINLLVEPSNLAFQQAPDGKYHASFVVVGFLINEMGKSLGGFSQTVTASLSPADYKRALAHGISYTGQATAPPGEYQLRAAVRDEGTGRLGSMSQFLEIPDLSKKRLTVSSLFLYAVDPAKGSKAKPEALAGLRELSRNQDLRYAAVIYNPKASGGKTQLQTRIIISRGGKVLFQEPDQPLTSPVTNGQVARIGQLGLGKTPPGRLMLTLVVTDQQGEKQAKTVVRKMDFLLVD
jgi:VWFA-related protein